MPPSSFSEVKNVDIKALPFPFEIYEPGNLFIIKIKAKDNIMPAAFIHAIEEESGLTKKETSQFIEVVKE